MPSLTPDLRRTARPLVVLLVALLLGASVGAPAAAQSPSPEPPPQVVVTLTVDGVADPEFIEVRIGDTVVFTNADDATRQVTATVEEGASTAWQYDSGLIAPGETSVATPVFEAAGRYTFNDAVGLLAAENRADEIGVLPPDAEPTPSPSEPGSPSEQPSPGPSGSASGSPSGSPSSGASPSGSASPGAAGSPPPAGGSGTTGPLPLTGGFGTLGSNPVPVPGDPLAPAIAPPLALGEQPPAPLPYVATGPPSRKGVTALPTGSLPGSSTPRGYGLPALLAALAIVGLTSLLVRVLLAEPAARREAEAARGVRPVLVTG